MKLVSFQDPKTHCIWSFVIKVRKDVHHFMIVHMVSVSLKRNKGIFIYHFHLIIYLLFQDFRRETWSFIGLLEVP